MTFAQPPPGDESNIGKEVPCRNCWYKYVVPTKKDDSLPANHIDEITGEKDNLRYVFGPSSPEPGRTHWCGRCELKNPVSKRQCGMKVMQMPGKPFGWTTQTVKSGGTLLKRHRCAGSADNVHNRNNTLFEEERVPTKTQKDVEYIMKTGKDPDLPTPIANNPIFGILKEEKKKAEFKTADKLLDNSGDFPDKELADNVEKAVEDRQGKIIDRSYIGEALDSLTKKLIAVIDRLEKAEGRIESCESRLDKIGNHIARIYQWIEEVQIGVNRLPVGGPP